MESEKFETVKLGNQEWMAKNMAVTVDRDGNELVLGKDYFYPNDDESLVKEYGLLYTWDAAMRIAPAGWHMPTDEEWKELEEYVGSQEKYRLDDDPENIAKALASTTGWEEDEDVEEFAVGNDQSKNNATGFNAVPAGGYIGSYFGFGYGAGFWSATQYDSSNAFIRSLGYNYAYVDSYDFDKYDGYSVRCLRD